MIKPYGIIPALITPFTKDQQIDEMSLRKVINWEISNGIHGIFCLGTNGEFFNLSYDEKIEIAEIVVDEVAGRVPVYAGSGCINTEDTIRLTKRLDQAGVDAVSIITPYFLQFTDKELIAHYQSIARSSELPIILYNIPSRTGNHLTPSSVAELAAEPNIVGIKDSSGSFENILNYIKIVDDDFSVLAGSDILILPTLLAGGKGAIASTANFIPNIIVSIYSNWASGDIEAARKAQERVVPICEAFHLGTLPSVLKAAMNMIGLPAGVPRHPVLSLEGNHMEELKRIVDLYANVGLLE